MLGGGALPPLHPYWPAFGRREILERLDLSVVLMDDGSGGAPAPTHPPLASASGLVRRSSASPFGHLISMIIIINNN